MMLQKEKEQQSEQHEQTLQKLQAKHEADISHLHQEHSLSAAKVHINTTRAHNSSPELLLVQNNFFYDILYLLQSSEVIEDLEKTVAQIKQQIQDSEHRRHQQVRVWFYIDCLVTFVNVF